MQEGRTPDRRLPDRREIVDRKIPGTQKSIFCVPGKFGLCSFLFQIISSFQMDNLKSQDGCSDLSAFSRNLFFQGYIINDRLCCPFDPKF